MAVPFVINVHNLNEDYIFPNAINCTYYQQMFMSIKKLNLFSKDEKFIKHLNDLNTKIFPNSKSEKDNEWINFTKFRDDMIARQVSKRTSCFDNFSQVILSAPFINKTRFIKRQFQSILKKTWKSHIIWLPES